ncbi:NmrA family NAD(P)-binding protein [Brevibacterium spongiae]|uniref:NmrA family NAD(P)-binding protein n=1 Tax=Brevibacterium spongiae TaxID=2909672 RepID=A0ABY5SPW1_9MICO|nr:NmrA family NAD(P)-binding protein [Brevibacterium spongiae]UVI36597.1 NmrA family NAD(P)-binding protein [Brevibacterium spongiae]
MYVIAGATGRVGSAAITHLLDRGAPVRALTRSEESAARLRSHGAEARIAALEDRESLTAALHGAAGLFVLLPFDLTVDDLDAHANRLISAISAAVTEAAVPHVVMLSSGGADRATGTGPITGLHRLEQALSATGTLLTALRPGHFQEKVAEVVDIAAETGTFPVFASSADRPMPLVATADIGQIVAETLLRPPQRSEAVDVLGPEYSEREIASVLAAELGRTLEVVTIPEEAWVPTLVETGLRPHIAAALAELNAADEHGRLAPRGDRVLRTSTELVTTIRRLLTPAQAAPDATAD